MSEKKNEKILVGEFVKKYNEFNNDASKAAYLKKIIKRTYCPILEKKLILEMMVEKSKGEGDIAYIDMVLSKINFYMSIIVLYTNLEVEKDDKGIPKTMDAYDMLKQADVFNAILNEIGEKEFGELMSVNDAALDTWHTKNTSTQAYISSLVEKVSLIFSTALGKEIGSLADMLNTGTDEDKAELVATLMENFKLK